MDGRNLLIVEDDETVRGQMKWAFCKEYNVFEASDRLTALGIVKDISPGVVILDLGLPPEDEKVTEGFKTLEELLAFDPVMKVIVVTGNTEKKNALRAVESGAFDFFTKPAAVDEMRVTVKRAFHVYELERENINLRKTYGAKEFAGLIGTSKAMQEVFAVIRKVAAVDVPVLILGESGTGKELAAAAIHRLGNRKEGPFIIINCGAIPETLLESELFGHEKGAFTGADARKKGKIELAQGGTLFLDEIGELSPLLQVKLLRFLQEKTIERIGGREAIAIDARIIAATNRDIGSMVKNGGFREDLFFRLSVVTLELPPLRARGDDAYILALEFLKRYSAAFRRDVRGFSKEAIAAMSDYGWPGNIRELENKIKGAVAMSQTCEITPEDLSFQSSLQGGPGDEVKSLIQAREEFEKTVILKALLKNKGVGNRAAKDLGISRQYLSELLKKYHIEHR